MSKLLYLGQRDGAENVVWKLENRRLFALPPRQCKEMSLPSHYDWGNLQPCSFSLSLALCSDALDDADLAVQLHVPFVEKAVSCFLLPEWMLTEEDIRELLTHFYQSQTGGVGVPMWRTRSFQAHSPRTVKIRDGKLTGR